MHEAPMARGTCDPPPLPSSLNSHIVDTMQFGPACFTYKDVISFSEVCFCLLEAYMPDAYMQVLP
jgi:hypothetical protein